MNVLVADDDDFFTHLIAARLTARGHTVWVAHDANTATMTALRRLPDVILLDIGMPGGSGIDVIQQIRAATNEKSPLIVVVSASPDQKLPKLVKSLGANAYLSKPIDAGRLVEIVESYGEAEPKFQEETVRSPK